MNLASHNLFVPAALQTSSQYPKHEYQSETLSSSELLFNEQWGREKKKRSNEMCTTRRNTTASIVEVITRLNSSFKMHTTKHGNHWNHVVSPCNCYLLTTTYPKQPHVNRCKKKKKSLFQIFSDQCHAVTVTNITTAEKNDNLTWQLRAVNHKSLVSSCDWHNETQVVQLLKLQPLLVFAPLCNNHNAR